MSEKQEHHHGREMSEEELRALFEQPGWDERYASKPAIWSGNPNPQLVAEATGLTPGTALDIGSGEGADAIWLATTGWQVTAMDFSQVALARAAQHAEQAGVSDRVGWRHADIRTWHSGDTTYDLVTSQFMHLPDGGMLDVTRRLSEAVAPGGTLLVVGHHPHDLTTGLRWSIDSVLFTPDELLPALDPDVWDIKAEVRDRQAAGPEGDPVTVKDSTLVARRR